jgi:2-polyprenyl-3-methyl-5-hydroxy-6-metoxy-1,4-benzoquinol methylase
VLTFEETYFKKRQYTHKELLVKRHVLQVLRWASKASNFDLLNGQGKRALDVGCATGYTSSVLTELGYQTCAIDISSWATKQAKSITKCQSIVCDAQHSLPFLPEVFDLVTCFDVLEHLLSPEKALANMFDASKGPLICTTPNKKLEKVVRKFTGDYDETHVTVKSPLEWKKCVTQMGGRSKIDTYFDFPIQLRDKLFFKSVFIPTYGLTIRIVVWK